VPVIGLSSSDHPASTETTIYVSAGAKASDSNDGLTTGTPKATIGSAKTALGSSPGTIVLLNGSWTVGTTDGHGNVLTLDNPGQWLRGQGINNTTVTVTTNATWLVRAAAAGCGAEGINWIIPTGVTVTHGVGVSPLVDPQSAHDCAFRELIIGVDGTLTNAYTLGPDFPGSSTQDIHTVRTLHVPRRGGGVDEWVPRRKRHHRQRPRERRDQLRRRRCCSRCHHRRRWPELHRRERFRVVRV
jgi:hypothetical protein